MINNPLANKGAVAVLDDENALVYFNAEFANLFPRSAPGLPYDAVIRDDTKNHFKVILDNPTINAVPVFFPCLNAWKRVAKARLDWPNKGHCNIVILSDDEPLIAEENSRFHGLYQEIYALNIKSGLARAVQSEDKENYISRKFVPYQHFIDAIAVHYIFPTDRQSFADFMDPEGLQTRIEAAGSKKAVYGVFRCKVDHDSFQRFEFLITESLRTSDTYLCFGRNIDLVEDAGDSSIRSFITSYQDFYLSSRKLIEQNREEYYIIAVDINHFKLYHNWYGREKSNEYLRILIRALERFALENKGKAYYLGSDDFVMVVPTEKISDLILIKSLDSNFVSYSEYIGFLPCFGLYRITDRNEPVQSMYEKALIALRDSRSSNGIRYRTYDDSFSQRYESEMKLINEIQNGIDREEFTFFIQPQFSLNSMKVVGSEALIRWNHPTRGMVLPGDFIPILERTSFIGRVDYYLWNKVMAWLKSRLDQGKTVLPISINVSISDIYTMDVPAVFRQLLHKHGLESKYVEVEITESAYAENSTLIKCVVKALQAIGIRVLMDDFGAGYSSLATLKSTSFDILKLDAEFLSDERNRRSTSIVESIISMAHVLGLRIIVEGIETESQKKFLSGIGCLYGQGYLFSKPLPIEQYEALIDDPERVDSGGIVPFSLAQLDMFSHVNSNENHIYEALMGPVATLVLKGNEVTVSQTSRDFNKLILNDKPRLQAFAISEVMSEDSFPELIRTLNNYYLGNEIAPFTEFEILRDSGESIFVEISPYFLSENETGRSFICSFRDVTAFHKRIHNHFALEKYLINELHKQSLNSANPLSTETETIASIIMNQLTSIGYMGGYCEDGFPVYFANENLIKMTGYSSYEDLVNGLKGLVENCIYIDDRPRVMKDLGPSYHLGQEYITSYRFVRKDGSMFWVVDKGYVIRAEDGRLAIVSIISDISDIVRIHKIAL